MVGAADASISMSASGPGAGSSAGVPEGAAASIGVAGGVSLNFFNRNASRFFSSVRKKTLIVVRNDLFGLQSSAATGVCSQTGHEEGREDWPGWLEAV